MTYLDTNFWMVGDINYIPFVCMSIIRKDTFALGSSFHLAPLWTWT